MISKLSACIGVFLLFMLVHVARVEAVVAPPASLLVSEIKLGGDPMQASDPKNYVSIVNYGDMPLQLDDYNLYIEYAKPSFPAASCPLHDWPTTNLASAKTPQLTGRIAPKAVVSIELSMTDEVSGSLRLISKENSTHAFVQHDSVSWGSSAPCGSDIKSLAPVPANGKSLERYIDCVTKQPVSTRNSANDFAVVGAPSFGVYAGPLTTSCQQDEEQAVGGGQGSALTCEGVIISEVLPNPAGSDAGHEFVELYNPTDEVISLSGCSLQTSGSSQRDLGAEELQPHEYRAFYGLTLANAAGGTVWLLSPTNDELDEITYRAELADDQAWVKHNGVWQTSFQPTPNADNVIVSLKPCSVGQERSAETGQCHTVATLAVATTTTSCKEGQERNPATNRCRSVTSTASTLTPCKAGQVRNPETNRCRTIASDASSLQPCDPGQERNLDTNRCRKVSAVAGAATTGVKDVYSGSIGASPRWWLAGGAILAAISYGIYEWRQEIKGFVRKGAKKA